MALPYLRYRVQLYVRLRKQYLRRAAIKHNKPGLLIGPRRA